MRQDHLFILSLGSAIIVLVGIASVLLLQEAKVRETNARISRSISGDMSPPALSRLQGFLAVLGDWLRRFYSPQNIDHLRSVVQSSGYNPHKVLPVLLGGKVVMMILMPLVAIVAAAFMSPVYRVPVVGAGVVIGLIAPEIILGIIRRQFIANVEKGTADALDLMVVCTESGMGLESALEHVSAEMFNSNRSVATVLAEFLNDLRVLPDRRDAFAKLAARNGLEGVRRFGTMLSQSMQHGTPLSDALRAIASELRTDRRNKLEERAVKLPAKLVFPLILFIMPTIWIALLGSTLLHLGDALKSAAKSALH